MYNRYIRNDNGSYERVAQDDFPGKPHAPSTSAKTQQPPHSAPSPPPVPPTPPPSPSRSPESHFFNRVLDKLHLGDIDSGDLLLLLILFLLFQEKADEELLIAIGLLLIL